MKDKIDNRLILMISSPSGFKYYNISAIFKDIFIYAFVFICTLLFFIFMVIFIFVNEIEDINKNYFVTHQNYEKLLIEHEELNQNIASKYEEVVLVTDKLEDLEDVVGINAKDNYDLQNRVEVASITGLQKVFIMKFVPNGYPMNKFSRISSPYGYRIHPISGLYEFHTGIDLAAKTGSDVHATADGVVDLASYEWNGGYGALIKVDHSFGFKTYYAHLDKLLVKKGDFIRRGQVIAHSGNTGISSGPHLHYEVRFLGSHLNPKNFIDWNLKNFGKIFEKERNVAWQSLVTTINSLMEQIPEEQRLSQREASLKGS